MRTEDRELEHRLAARLASLRAAAGWSLEQLAEATGLSRATLNRFERGETSPAAGQLNRLCAAYGLTLSRLLAELEQPAEAPYFLLRAAEQTSWRDPAGHFTRHLRCPPRPGFASELLEIELRPGTPIDYDRPPVRDLEHHLLMQAGRLQLTLHSEPLLLRAGDSLSFKCRGASRFEALGATPARYLLALSTPA